MKCIVGLGNPGTKYLFTRHNIGFMLVDILSGGEDFQKKHESLIKKIQVKDQFVLLVKPQTYMNLSGKAVRDIMSFYKIPFQNLLVVQDDIDQEFLHLKFQNNRGHGGHNGIRSIHNELKTSNYARLKLGIGRNNINLKSEGLKNLQTSLESLENTMKKFIPSEPKTPKPADSILSIAGYRHHTVSKSPSPANYVLSPFLREETPLLQKFLSLSAQAALCFIEKGLEPAANKYNGLHKTLSKEGSKK